MEGFSLDGRDDVLNHLADPPILVEPLPEGDDPDLDFPVCYRSLLVPAGNSTERQKVMTDSALAEFSFVKAFFHAEDSAVFSEIFREVCKYVPLFPLFDAAANADGGVVRELVRFRGRFAGGDADPIGADGSFDRIR